MPVRDYTADTIPLAYYNDIDPYCCQWLQNLIDAGLIPPGLVDNRSIVDIQPHEISRYRQVHLFAGLGGWAYALQLAGWPEHIPVWTGSCPCQPFSAAGKRKGTADARHLWPEMYRLIASNHRHPPIIFGEQVASKDGRIWLSGIRSDLETLGHEVGAADLCAAGIGAPHIRQRLYWVADSMSTGWAERWAGAGGGPVAGGGGASRVANTEYPERWAEHQEHTKTHGRNGFGRGGGIGRLEQSPIEQMGIPGQPWEPRIPSPWSHYSPIPCLDGKTRRVEPGTFPLANGVPARVGRLRAYGNAIVPQVAAEFITAYMEAVGILPY